MIEYVWPLLVICAAAGVLLVMIAASGVRSARGRRRRQMRDAARSFGFLYSRSDAFDLGRRLRGLRRLEGLGAARPRNVLWGQYASREFIIFDTSAWEEDASCDCTALAHRTALRAPATVVRPRRPEDVGDVPLLVDRPDRHEARFESDAFNRAFRIVTAEQRFAYDLCCPGVIELLMEHPRCRLHLEDDLMLLWTMDLWHQGEAEQMLSFAGKLLDRIPEHLRRQYAAESQAETVRERKT